MSDPNGWPASAARGYWDCDCGRECRNKPLTLGCRAEWKDAEARPFPAPLQMHEEPTTRRLYTPAEVAAREAAAFNRGAEAMRADCAAIVDAHAAAAKRCSEESDVIYRIRAEFLANFYAITQAADDVRVTPLPESKT